VCLLVHKVPSVGLMTVSDRKVPRYQCSKLNRIYLLRYISWATLRNTVEQKQPSYTQICVAELTIHVCLQTHSRIISKTTGDLVPYIANTSSYFPISTHETILNEVWLNQRGSIEVGSTAREAEGPTFWLAGDIAFVPERCHSKYIRYIAGMHSERSSAQAS
jgi:hypothetical protein